MKTRPLLFAALFVSTTTLPTRAVAQPSGETQNVPLSIESTGEPLDFYAQRIGDTSDFTFLCLSPCDAQLPPGSYRLALAPRGKDGDRIWLESTFDIQRPVMLRGAIESRADTRRVGWGLFIGGLLLTGTMALAWHEQPKYVDTCPGSVGA